MPYSLSELWSMLKGKIVIPAHKKAVFREAVKEGMCSGCLILKLLCTAYHYQAGQTNILITTVKLLEDDLGCFWESLLGNLNVVQIE